jgi:hypothetical protein
VRCGATLEQVLEALRVIEDLVPAQRLEESRRVVERFARA